MRSSVSCRASSLHMQPEPMKDPGRTIANDFSGSELLFYDAERFSTSLADFMHTGQVIDLNSIRDFLLFGSMLPPHTPLDGVSQLFPGESLHAQGIPPLYAELSYEVNDRSISWYVDAFDRALEQCVADSEDVSAVLLSGGIDSAILLSYVPRGATCITWGGAGIRSSDVEFSRLSASAFGAGHHEIVLANADYDLELYKDAVRRLKFPLLFLGVVPFLRMAEAGKRMGIAEWLVGQNADTLFMSYPAPVLAKRLSILNAVTPFNPLSLLQDRRRYLGSTASVPRLLAYFKSLGIFPGSWIDVPERYFEEKETLFRSIPARNRDQAIIVFEELVSEARRNQINQNEIPSLFGITSVCPFYERDVVALALGVPPRMRRMGRYGKVILKELAKKRGVPEAVIYKKKSGLSYGFKDFIGQNRHLPIWERMEQDPDLNACVDVRAVRAVHQDNYYTFSLLMSLHYWFDLVARPEGLIIPGLKQREMP